MNAFSSAKSSYWILAIFAGLLYINTLNHAYVLDDFSVIKDNRIVQQGFSGISEIFATHYREGYGFVQGNLYRPLTLSLFAIQWELFPDTPAVGHLCNVLLYALGLLLLYQVLSQLIQKPQLVFLSVLLFAAHPIHTEVVANIKSADELLAFVFFLSAFHFLLRFLETNQKKFHWLSLFLFFLGFLSKESMLSYLGILVVSLVLFRQFSWSRALKITSSYAIPFGAYLLLRAQALGSISGDKTVAKIDNLLVGLPQPVRLATAVKIMGLYLWKLIFPHPLVNDYSLKAIAYANFSSWEFWLSLLIYALLIYVLIKYWKRNKVISFSIAFFLIGIALYSNLVLSIGTSFGERLLFVPSLGFCLALAYGIQFVFKETKGLELNWKSKSMLLVAGVSLFYGFKTIDRNAAWKDNYTLYATDIKNCENSARCQYYYGLGLMKERAMLLPEGAERTQLIQEAILAFTRSVELYPNYSDAYGQRGLAYYRLNQPKAALYDYQKSVEFNPNNATTWSNMGSIYFESQQYQEALRAYEQALKAKPNYADALANYGSTLGTVGQYSSAITYFKKALSLKPDEAEYVRLIALTFQNMGNDQQAQIYMNQYKQMNGN